MKKTLICFISGVLMAQSGAMAAVTIKKAASVSKKENKNGSLCYRFIFLVAEAGLEPAASGL